MKLAISKRSALQKCQNSISWLSLLSCLLKKVSRHSYFLSSDTSKEIYINFNMKLLIILITLLSFNQLCFSALDFDVCEREGLNDKQCKELQEDRMRDEIKRAIDELKHLNDLEPDQVNQINLESAGFSFNSIAFGDALVIVIIVIVFAFVIRSLLGSKNRRKARKMKKWAIWKF